MSRTGGGDWADAHDDMDYGVLPTFPDGRQHAPSDYEREKQQAFEAELQAAQQDARTLTLTVTLTPIP